MHQAKSIRLLDHQPDTGNKPERQAYKKTRAQTYLYRLCRSHVHHPLSLALPQPYRMTWRCVG